MRTVLVLSETPELPEALAASLGRERYRVLHRSSFEEAEPFLAHGLAQVCIVDVERTLVQGLWLVEKIRQRAPKCPLILVAGTKTWEWEEEAFEHGVSHVLLRPIRPRVFAALLERICGEPGRVNVVQPIALPHPASPAPEHPVSAPAGQSQALGVLRDFSAILTHSLNAEAMLRQFLLLLRDILNINRGVVFLRQPLVACVAQGLEPADGHRLRAACAVGLSTSLLQHFELTFESGIGRHLFRSGRILRRGSEEARHDLEAQKEFELLGSQVAVPILDRENVLGAAVFDSKITGEPLSIEELQLVFHLLEQLGLAVKNIWLHNQLSSNHRLMTEILRELGSACVVVGSDLTILHANRMGIRYFGASEGRQRDLEFSDLPAVLSGKVYQVLKTGAAIPTFRFEPEKSPGTVYNVCIVPFQREQGDLPSSALLMAEDLTQSEQLKKLEIESENLRLIKEMAVRLVNEMGNALVPLASHQQVLEEKLQKHEVDLEFLKLMARNMGDSVRRVTRLASQMRFLARDELLANEAIPVGPLLEEAFEEARKHQPSLAAVFQCHSVETGTVVKGDRAALKHALAEIMLNGLQANPSQPQIGVRVLPEQNGSGSSRVNIEVRDSGPGFTPEALKKLWVPFFSTKVVGVGLGLPVSRKIVESHRGRVEVIAAAGGSAPAGCVRISLPVAGSAKS